MLRQALPLDVLIFGGGAAGLWLLDELVRGGHSAVLLETGALGAGQTIASQGIIHGGFKYTLSGAMNDSACAINDLPQLWRRCLAGDAKPDLSHTSLRSECCHLWSNGRLLSKLAMLAASWVLKVKPMPLPRQDWPAALKNMRGSVSRMDEQIIVPRAFIADLAQQHHHRLLHIGSPRRYDIVRDAKGNVPQVVIHDDTRGDSIAFAPKHIVLTAGKGNAALRAACGLGTNAMQVRPVHMIMARGPLPLFNGHCIDANKARVTITSDTDTQGRCLWQVGGQISEDGVSMSQSDLIDNAQRELRDVLPAVDFTGVEWATFRADKAEGTTAGGARPSDAVILHEGNIITCWPTKLVLAPVAASRILHKLPAPSASPIDPARLRDWPKPEVAMPPWEIETNWTTTSGVLRVA
ncbi:MAG: FAD-dependent oxidoreductase [Phycisphaeraceae bacterium]